MEPTPLEVDVLTLPVETEDGTSVDADFALLHRMPNGDHDIVVLCPAEQLEGEEGIELDLLIYAWTEHDNGDVQLDEVEDELVIDKALTELRADLFDDEEDGSDDGGGEIAEA